MEKYNKAQKSFLNYLIKYKRNSVVLPFSDIFYSYIKKNYHEVEIELVKGKIIFYKKDEKCNLNSIIYTYIDEIMSLFYLILILRDEKSIVYYGKKEELKNTFKVKNKTNKLFEINFNNKIEEDLNKNFLINPNLKELINSNFKTLEQKSLFWTKWALYFSIFFSGVGIIVNLYTSTSVTKIEFNKPEQLKEISTTIRHLK